MEFCFWCRGDNASLKVIAPALITFLLIISMALAISAVTFVSPTPANNTRQEANYTGINITVPGPDFNSFIFNWNGTNYTFYDSTLILAMNFNNNSAAGENNTKFADVSMYGNNATCDNAGKCPNITSAGKFGKGLWFDGTDDYIETGSFIDNQIDYARYYSKDSSASLQKNASSSWESEAVGDPFIVRNGSTTYLFYAGYNGTNWQTGFATNASANLTQWTRYGNNPVMRLNGSGWDGYHVLGASLLHYPENSSLMQYNGAYWMAYEGVNGQSQIGIANSTDLITWTRYANNPVIMLGGSYDSQEVGDPYLFFDNETSAFYILYSAKGSDGRWSIALANSTDMLNWQKENANPILRNSTAGFDNQDVGSPAILKKNGTWYLVYPGYNSNTYVNQIGTAYGTSLFGLNKTSSSPAIAVSEAFDIYGVGDPAVVNDGEETYIFYEAIQNADPNNASNASIVRAVNYNPLSINFWLNLSSMGNWNRWLAKGTTATPREWLFISDVSGVYKFSVFKNGAEKYATKADSLGAGYNYITGQYDGSYVRLLVNGAEVASTALKGKIDTTSQPLFIGKENGDGNYLSGTIDELRIYNRSLSSGEIQMHYASEMQKYGATGLVFYGNRTGLIDGIYSYSAYIGNSTGNINETGKNIVIVDTVPPAITITNPANRSALSSGTASTWINITTDENAVCRYNLTNSSFSFSEGTNFTATGNTSHSFQYSGLSDGQSYALYYKCNDTLGHVNNASAYHAFSVSSAAAVTTTSSGGGGGSGGGGSSAKKTITITPAAPLVKIIVNFKKSLESPSANVTYLVSFTPSPNGNVYQYAGITRRNFNNSDIQNATIEFAVSKQWISANNISNIRMLLYENGWSALKTEFINSSASANYYRAYTDRLTYLAISGEKTAILAEPVAETLLENATGEEKNSTAELPEEVNPPASNKEQKPARSFLPYLAITGILAIAIGAYAYRNSGRNEEHSRVTHSKETALPKNIPAAVQYGKISPALEREILPEIHAENDESDPEKRIDRAIEKIDALRRRLNSGR